VHAAFEVEIENEIPASTLMVYTALTLVFLVILTVARSHAPEPLPVTAVVADTIVRVMVSVLGPGALALLVGRFSV
jgi:hypothetical protein